MVGLGSLVVRTKSRRARPPGHGPTFIKIWKGKSVQGFKPDPYVATVLNCAMWVFYGLPIVHPDSLLVFTINGIGFVIEIAYITIFLLFSNWAMRVPNGLGTLSGLVQLVLYATYYKTTNWDEDEMWTEIELPTAHSSGHI
ncbi:unnamed protein product [Fraxinus pennsylvanica]|uniref:Uncharacterized protein n=1 Tax=Fraxinus pennsylvanica TaxID=56036 RepID=A0AAD1YWP1_9LAMI|nr:unnamed protein product [Fraxinus pennsylvanica]